jgi:hypothetical protein
LVNFSPVNVTEMSGVIGRSYLLADGQGPTDCG